MSSKKSKSKAEEGIQQAAAPITQAGTGVQAAGQAGVAAGQAGMATGQQVYGIGKQTPEEAAQYAGSFDLGKIIQAILQYQQGLGQAPQGYLSPEQQYLQQTGELGKSYYGQTLADARDPYGTYTSTLQPQLALAQDYINRQAQGRGLLRSGIPIEQMGRAGVELAIQEANNRLAYRQQALGRAGELSQYTQGIGQQNLANLSNLYGQQQGYGQVSMGRNLQAAGGLMQGAQMGLQGAQLGLQGATGQLGAAENAAGYAAAPSLARLGSYYGTQQGLMGLAGQALGAGGTIAASYLGRPQTTNYFGYPYQS